MSLADRIQSLTPEQRQLLLDRLSAADTGPAPQEEIAAYVVCRPGHDGAVAELRSFVSAQLPDFMVPTHFVPLPSLPRHPNGKVDRHALPRPETIATKPAEPARAPNPIEARLKQLWSEVLRIENPGLDDNFFQLGGHSLLALRLMARVREAFHANLPIKALFQAPTIAGLARAIAKHSSNNAPLRRIAHPGGPNPQNDAPARI